MAIRVIKNYTNEDLVLRDLGMVTIPNNGAVDIGGNESRLIELASSEDLLAALSQGINKYQLNDGSRDLNFSEGIELIRKIHKPTQSDLLGRWIVRVDSRRENWDTIFTGAGDDLQTMTTAGGVPFLFDFSAPVDDSRWVSNPLTGYRQQSIKWNFFDPVYIKEGTLYYFDMPKGSYVDFYIGVTEGHAYDVKFIDENLNVRRDIRICSVPYLRFAQWVSHYHVESSAPMGDELNTESAAEVPIYPFHIFECVVTVPETPGWENAHGHWGIELYRPRTLFFSE